jgi:hypothetical protein
MPHIEQIKRARFDKALEPLLDHDQELKIADIEYIISQLVQHYVMHNGINFNTLKDIDALFGAGAKEFYRCVTGPYEAFKAGKNGNAYWKLVEIIDEMREHQ